MWPERQQPRCMARLLGWPPAMAASSSSPACLSCSPLSLSGVGGPGVAAPTVSARAALAQRAAVRGSAHRSSEGDPQRGGLSVVWSLLFMLRPDFRVYALRKNNKAFEELCIVHLGSWFALSRFSVLLVFLGFSYCYSESSNLLLAFRVRGICWYM